MWNYPVCGIAPFAFCECEDAETLRLPSTLKYISDSGLQFCGVSSLTIPEGVETIGHMAFSYMHNLTSIQLPASLATLDHSVFLKSRQLATITISDNNTHYKAVDNVLLSRDGKKLLCYPTGKFGNTYSIPEGVEELDYYAFEYTMLKHLNIPASLKSITDHSIDYNPELEDVNVAEGNASFYSHEGVLYGQDATMLLYPVAKRAGAYTVPDATRRLGNYAFSRTRFLRKLEVPASVESIGYEFCMISSLDTVIVRSTVPPVIDHGDMYLTKQTVLVVPDGCVEAYDNAWGWDRFPIIVDSHSNINTEEFVAGNLRYQRIGTGEDNLEVRVMGFAEYPDKPRNLAISKTAIHDDVTYTVTEIAPFAFSGCYELLNVTIPSSVTHIGKFAFYDSSLAKVTFATASKLQSIGNYAFGQCFEGTTFSLPISLREIGNYAFMDYGNWETSTPLSIPRNVEKIGIGAFDFCNTISDFTVTSQNTHFATSNGVLYNDNRNKLVAYPMQKQDDTFHLMPGVDTIQCTPNYDLRRLVINSNEPPVCLSEMERVIDGLRIFVPTGTKDAYMADPMWSQSREIVERGKRTPTMADGGYYLYNREMDAFLSRGADWGLRASMELTCVPISIIGDVLDDTYRMKYYDAYYANNYLGADEYPYTDKMPGKSIEWEIHPVEDGRYLLYNIDYGKWLQGGNLHTGCSLTNDVSEAIPFEFIHDTDEYNSIISSRSSVASEITPTMVEVDVTDLLKNPTMATSLNYWNTNFTMQYTNGSVTHRSGLCELYHGYGSLNQTIRGLQPGIYKFALEGFYRGGTNELVSTYDRMGISLQSALIFANRDEQPFATWASARMSDTYPNTMEEAYSLISKGLYRTEVYTRVGENGILNVGLALPQGVYQSWLIWRNATLSYYQENGDGIQDMAVPATMANTTVYSLSGVKQNGLKPGLNIVRDQHGRYTKVVSRK